MRVSILLISLFFFMGCSVRVFNDTGEKLRVTDGVKDFELVDGEFCDFKTPYNVYYKSKEVETFYKGGYLKLYSTIDGYVYVGLKE